MKELIRKSIKKLSFWRLVVAILALLFALYQWDEAGENNQKAQDFMLGELDSIRKESNANFKLVSELVQSIKADATNPIDSMQPDHSDSLDSDSAVEVSSSTPAVIPNLGKKGWLYAGKYVQGSRDDSYWTTTSSGVHKPKKDDVLEIEESVSFNTNFPRFPRWENGLKRASPVALVPGTFVRVLDVREVGLRNFTWIEVEIARPGAE